MREGEANRKGREIGRCPLRVWKKRLPHSQVYREIRRGESLIIIELINPVVFALMVYISKGTAQRTKQGKNTSVKLSGHFRPH